MNHQTFQSQFSGFTIEKGKPIKLTAVKPELEINLHTAGLPKYFYKMMNSKFAVSTYNQNIVSSTVTKSVPISNVGTTIKKPLQEYNLNAINNQSEKFIKPSTKIQPLKMQNFISGTNDAQPNHDKNYEFSNDDDNQHHANIIHSSLDDVANAASEIKKPKISRSPTQTINVHVSPNMPLKKSQIKYVSLQNMNKYESQPESYMRQHIIKSFTKCINYYT